MSEHTSAPDDADPVSTDPVSMDPVSVDPVIVEVVENVRDRFGTQGLCDLIALARDELTNAEAALKDLSEPQ